MREAVKDAIENGSATHSNDGTEVQRNGGLIRVACTLSQITPLLMNSMSEEQLLAIRDKKKAPKNAAKPTPRDEADSKVYRLADGRPHMPVKNLYSCLIAAGAFVRLDGKRQISTAKSTVLPGMLSIEDVELPIFGGEGRAAAKWEVDIQQGRNPNGGEAVCIIRPRFDAWEIRATLEIDQQQMSESMARELVEIAGRRIGLGDGRPQKKLTFGRFSVRRWERLAA